jgi:signal transduction histidine kinase
MAPSGQSADRTFPLRLSEASYEHLKTRAAESGISLQYLILSAVSDRLASHFGANLSHEVLNGLFIVVGECELLLEEVRGKPAINRIRVILETALRLADDINEDRKVVLTEM